MKKIVFSSFILVLILGLATPVMAQTDTPYNGTVVSIDTVGDTFQLQVSETEIYTVVPPAGFNLALLSVGGTARVIGTLTDATITASQILLSAEYVGKVTAIGLTAGTFTFQAKTGVIFTVTPPEGFDLASLGTGDVLIVTGWQETDTLIATSIQLLFNGDGEGNKGGNYCQNLNNIHKVAQSLAERSGLYYEQIMSWFCVDRLGFGEIQNAIKANEKLEGSVSVAEILAMKTELGGWGKVKQELGLIGKGKNQITTQDELQHGNGHAHGKDKDKNKSK